MSEINPLGNQEVADENQELVQNVAPIQNSFARGVGKIIQHIGKLFVLWRPIAEKADTPNEDRMPGPRDVKVLKYSKRGGQRPEVKTLRVLGNQRLTSGGQVKRAKPKKTSIKKRTLG